MPSKKPEVPRGLSKTAVRWWKRFQADYALDDAGGRLLLESALRQFDRAEEARAVIDKEGSTVVDRFGQRRAHPAAAIERDARSGLLGALRALNLDLVPLKDGPGRPVGS